jgi:single-stranded-DNA-specific exonuclease
MKDKFWNILNKSEVNSNLEILNIIYKNRSLTKSEDITSFLKPSLNNINFKIGDIDKVVSRLKKAIETKEKIVVYGDYDADGVTASAIMWETLHSLGANARPYIPHREKEGYGMSIVGIDNIIESEDAKLIVTVDQGISCKKQIAYAKSKGIEVIVTDHHHKPAELPEDCYIVHDSSVCGAGVSWKVATSLLRLYQSGSHPEEHRDEGSSLSNILPPQSLKLLELVAIGMVCDLIPLQGEARTLVYYGLEQLKKSERPGIKAIAKQSAIKLNEIETYHIGYIIGPRINATGRLDHAMDSLRLLCTKDQDRADLLAQKVNDVNTDRKELTFALIDQAKRQAEQQKQNKFLVIGSPEWNPGIIGLVASRMIEEYYKPTVVWGSSSEAPNIYKASARSIKGFNIIDAITENSAHLISFGGHPMAAGFSFQPQSLDNFTKAITASSKSISEEMLIQSLEVDCKLPLSLASETLFRELQTLKPFGTQAEEPLFYESNIQIIDAQALGATNKHLKLKIANPQTKKPVEAIAFGFGEYSAKIRPGMNVDLAFHLDLNEWNGNKKIQLKVRDIKISQK